MESQVPTLYVDPSSGVQIPDIDAQITAFRQDAETCVNYVCEYTKTVDKQPVFPDVTPGYLRKLLPKNAPKTPEAFMDMLKDFHQFIIPGTMHWVHPDMYAYFPCGNSFSNVLADMLATSFGGVGFSWVSDVFLDKYLH